MPRYVDYYQRQQGGPENEGDDMFAQRRSGSLAGGSAISPTQSPYSPNAGDAGAPVGRFVNFGRYFSLNADKARGMAQNVGGAVRKQGEDVRSGIGSAVGSFNKAVDKGSLSYMEPAFGPPTKPTAATADVTAAGPAVRSAENGATPPSQQQAKTPNAEKTWRNMMGGAMTVADGQSPQPSQLSAVWGPKGGNAPRNVDEARAASQTTYSGPSSLESQAGYDELGKAADKAGKAADNLGQDGDLQALLGEQYGALGGYATPMGAGATGKSRLDAGLTGVAGRPMFDAISKQFGGDTLKNELGQANWQSKITAANAKANTEAAAKMYGRDVEGYGAAQQLLDKQAQPDAIRIGAAGGELGWGPEISDDVLRTQLKYESTLDQARGGDVDFEQGLNGMAYTWSNLKGYEGAISPETAQRVLDTIDASDWSGYQAAVKKGPAAIMAWLNEMKAKYGIG